jgi:hypothetical protein
MSAIEEVEASNQSTNQKSAIGDKTSRSAANSRRKGKLIDSKQLEKRS